MVGSETVYNYLLQTNPITTPTSGTFFRDEFVMKTVLQSIEEQFSVNGKKCALLKYCLTAPGGLPRNYVVLIVFHIEMTCLPWTLSTKTNKQTNSLIY